MNTLQKKKLSTPPIYIPPLIHILVHITLDICRCLTDMLELPRIWMTWFVRWYIAGFYYWSILRVSRFYACIKELMTCDILQRQANLQIVYRFKAVDSWWRCEHQQGCSKDELQQTEKIKPALEMMVAQNPCWFPSEDYICSQCGDFMKDGICVPVPETVICGCSATK